MAGATPAGAAAASGPASGCAGIAPEACLDSLFTGASQLVEDPAFTVDLPGAFRNGAGTPGHPETSTVDFGAAAGPVVNGTRQRYAMLYRTFVRPDGTRTSNGVPAGIALAYSVDGNSWTIQNGGKAVLGERRSSAAEGAACQPAPCVLSIYAPTVAITGTGSAGQPRITMLYETMDTGVLYPNVVPRHWIEGVTSDDYGMTWSPPLTTVPPGSTTPTSKLLVGEVPWEGFDSSTNNHDGNVGTPDLRYENGTLFVTYHGYSNATAMLARGTATGSAGAVGAGATFPTLTRELADPTFKPSTNGDWMASGPGKASDFRQGDYYVYRIFEAFRGGAGCGSGSTTVGWGLARSTDLRTWQYAPTNPMRMDRMEGSCGEDMPSWQVVAGVPNVIVTNYDNPLPTQPTVRRYKALSRGAEASAVGVCSVAAIAISDRDDSSYFELSKTGAVAAFGAAAWRGDASAAGLTNFTGMAVMPDGSGYWLTTAAGRVFPYGSAPVGADLSKTKLRNVTVVGIERIPDGTGYWLVTSDGRVFSSVANGFVASAPSKSKVVAMVVAPGTSGGFWLLRSDGTLIALNGAPKPPGSLASIGVTATAVGVTLAPSGGYWITTTTGRVYGFDGATSYGDTGGYQPLPHFQVAAVARRGVGSSNAASGYYLAATDGAVVDLGHAVWQGHVSGTSWNT